MTSIEWLIEEMLSKGYFKESVTLTNIDHLQYKAEELHKQEIIDAYEQGSDDEIVAYDGTRKYKHGLEYYTYTYGSKGSDDHISDISKMVEVSQEEKQDEIIKATEENFNKRADAFHQLVKIVEQVKDKDDRLNLFISLQNYIQCN
jgi:hypothetical protein